MYFCSNSLHTFSYGTVHSKMDQEKNCERQTLKNLKYYDLSKKTISLQIFKTFLLGPFFNTLSHICLCICTFVYDPTCDNT